MVQHSKSKHNFSVTIPFGEPLNDEELDGLIKMLNGAMTIGLFNTELDVISKSCKRAYHIVEIDGEKKKKLYQKAVVEFNITIPWEDIIDETNAEEVSRILRQRIYETGLKGVLINSKDVEVSLFGDED